MDQGGEDEYFLASLENEAIEVECLLVEPKDDHITVDGVFCFGKGNPENCVEIEGGPGSISTRKTEDKLKVEVFDVMPHEVGVENLRATSDVPCASDDYLLDFEFAESISKMEHIPGEELHLGHVLVPVPKCQNDLKTICELHCGSSTHCGCEASVEDKLWLKCPIPYELQSIDSVENVLNAMDRGVSSSKNDKVTIFTPGPTAILENNEVGPVGRAVVKEMLGSRDVSKSSSAKNRGPYVFPTRKRSRRPPQRYIEESSDLSSKRRRQKISTATSSDKSSGARSHKNQDIGSKAMVLVTEESIGTISIPVPFGLPVQIEGRKKHGSILEPKEEPSPDESEDEHASTLQYGKSASRRKHHKLWTLLEVKKLIDGVSQHGVGKWTVIKKLLFSSSDHRTPVDLKDKWRNLLRTSCIQTHSKRQDEHKPKTAWRPLPKSVLRRVSELAIVHPYPRDQKSRDRKSIISHVRHLSAPAPPARRTTGAPSSFSERKNCK